MKNLWAPWRMEFILENQTKTGCVFCNLASEGKDAANLILGRSKHSFILLNKYPYNPGHLMVIPFKHTASFSELPDAALTDLQQRLRDSVDILTRTMSPQGFNLGMNLGEAGGAGIRDHLHYHLVPRWNGDTNYMPILGETKVLPEALAQTFSRLSPVFKQLGL